MSSPDETKAPPRASNPTTIDPAGPFDSVADRRVDTNAVRPRQTQLASDPPTAVVKRDSFRELPPGSVVDDTYEVDAKIGAGAMGEVYAARHIKLGKRVAIKVISRRLSEDDDAIERFAMEARTLAQIQHPAIVAVEHVGELADGRAYFVMEFLRGESLFDRLARGHIPLAEALRVLDQMARGLEAAHGKGVIHRDLKPENVFLVHMPGEPPIIKLVDYGLAKLAADVAELDFRAERTQSGVAIGTPMYMSPEQMRGPDVDHRTDIYALGCVAYELLLGVPLFPNARTTPELYAAHLHEQPPMPRSIWPAIPQPLDLVLFAMIAKDPAQRPTLAAFREVVAAVLADLPAGTRAATMRVEPQRSSRRWWAAAIAAVMLAGGIAIGALLASSRPAPTLAPAPSSSGTPNTEQIVTPMRIPTTETAPTTAPTTKDADSSTRRDKPERPAQRPPSRQSTKRAGSATDASTASKVPPDARPEADAASQKSPPTSLPSNPQINPPIDPPINRDQTINPFKRKANQ